MIEEPIEIDFDVSNTLEQYRPLYGNDYDVALVWGGRDGGKSFNIPHPLVEKCLSLDYFKCILCRKVKDTVKESLHAEVSGFINDYNLSDLFTIGKAPMEIHCVNGNYFLPRGFDEPKKIKSVKEPTHAWADEGDQITENDFDYLWTTLRATNVNTQIILSFNPEHPLGFREHWIWDRFLKHVEDEESLYGNTVRFNIRIEGEDGEFVDIRVLSIHTTCEDNPYADPKRKAIYKQYKEFDENKYTVFYKGRPGESESGTKFVTIPFIINPELEFDSINPIVLSFDNNTAPMSCLISQHDYNLTWNKDLLEFQMSNVDFENEYLPALEEMLMSVVPNYNNIRLIITGDPNCNNSSATSRGNLSQFAMAQEYFDLTDEQVIILKHVSHSNHKLLFNKCQRVLDFQISDQCTQLIKDMKGAKVEVIKSASGVSKMILKKDNRKNESEKLDLLDCSRYNRQAFFYEMLLDVR